LAFARSLLERGCNVVIADLSLRPEARDIVQAHPDVSDGSCTSNKGKAVFHRTDVSSWTDLSGAFSAAKSRFGKIDIVCAGAGVFEPSWSSFWKPRSINGSSYDLEDGDGFKSIDVNLVHPVRLTQMAIIDHLNVMKRREKDKGPHEVSTTIIHISSVNGQVTPLWSPLYNASKHGINGFVRTLAPLEQRFGIRVAAVAPGLVKTPLWSGNPHKTAPVSPNVAWVTPEEVAKLMLSIVENDSVQGRFRLSEAELENEVVPIQGGSILEISGDTIRAVQAFHDAGPQGISDEDFNVAAMEKSVFRDLEKCIAAD
jgi:3-hydroxybutyrate dehydrogenase